MRRWHLHIIDGHWYAMSDHGRPSMPVKREPLPYVLGRVDSRPRRHRRASRPLSAIQRSLSA